MSDILSQRSLPEGNELLGFSKYYIHAYGATLTVLAEILGISVSEANAKLKSVDGFSPDANGEKWEINWDKIVPAFPEWSAQYITPYNNDTVLDALSKGQFVIVITGGSPSGDPALLHAVRYMGNGVCHDPWDSTEKPTNTYPDVKGMVILTHNMTVQAPTEEQTPTVPADPEQPNQPDQTESLAVTLANLPAHEKQALVDQAEKTVIEIKKLLGL